MKPSTDTLSSHGKWNWHPPLPVRPSPVFDWPPDPRAAFAWLAGYWLKLSMVTAVLALAFVYWRWLQPGESVCTTLEIACVGGIYLRNLLVFCLVAGGLHGYFYRYRRQRDRLKFDRQWMAVGDQRFTFGDQVYDNIFWSLVSGVTVWTAYDLFYAWGSANGWYPVIGFSDHPVWFVAWFPLILFWASFHFFCIHRLLHLPFLYRRVHALHHRNITVGPWSGLSMHPLEHLLYFSGVLIHLWVPSHPLHVFFHILGVALYPLATHSGFERLLLGRNRSVALGSFYHQLHHRYFKCNYGTVEVPCDRWFGGYHDGSEQHNPLRRTRSQG